MAEAKRLEAEAAPEQDASEKLTDEAAALSDQADWLDETIVEIIISEAQNEVVDFKKWGFDIIPHRERMKRGFETPDGERVDVETGVQGSRSSLPCGRRLRHVAHGIRCGIPVDPLHRQTDEGA